MTTKPRQATAQFLAGEFCLFSKINVPEALRPTIRAEQISSITRLTPAMMIGNICNASVGFIATLGAANWPAGLLWAITLSSYCIYLLTKQQQAQRRGPLHVASKNAIFRAIKISFLLGLLWACLPILLLMQPAQSSATLVVAISAGMVCIGAFCLAAIPAAALFFILPLALTSLLAIWLQSNGNFHLIAMLTAALMLTLMRAVCAFHAQLFQRIVDRAAAEEKAHHDPLTGLLNRRGFEEYIKTKAMEPLKRHGRGFTVICLDLDNFKAINDTYDHTVADTLLVRIAERLDAMLSPDDCIARMGGDQFCIIGLGNENPRIAAKIAERIVRSFHTPHNISGRKITCSASLGIALAPSHGEDAANILKNADRALFQAKQNKRGGYVFFDSSLDERQRKHQNMSQSLRSALAKKELFLEYQPIYSTRGKRVTGFEALLRWRHSEFGIVSPAEFIPIAEELGLIQDIGEWVIDHVCEAMTEWPDHMRGSVNFSPIQLSSPSLVDFTLAALQRRAINPTRFEIEITESMPLEHDDASLSVLEDMADNGISVALDDFGTGYSSMTYVCNLPLDRVKIDRSFVATCLQTPQSLAVVQAIIGLAHSLDLEVVAEGIETMSQYHMLAGMGCEEIQGYLLSRPLSQHDASVMANESAPILQQVA